MAMHRGRSASLIDVYVARRIRQRRLQLGLSQQALAERLGITIQQVQKYEHGANRISASRLLAIAVALDAPVSHFYVGAEVLRRAASLARVQGDLPLLIDIGDLLIAWTDAGSEADRQRIMDLVRSAARGQQVKDRAQIVFVHRAARVPAHAAVPRNISRQQSRPGPDRASAGW